VKEVFPRFGIPKTIISDNGKQFVSGIFRTMCGMFGIKRKNTSYYHPQPNLAERTIKTIRTMITTSIKESHREWDQNLPYIAMAIRSAVSMSTGYSPAFLTLGRELRLPCDPDAMEAEEVAEPDTVVWATTLTKRVREAISNAQQNIKAQADRQKKYYDAKRRDLSFSKGDLVWKRTHWLSDKDAGFMKKLAPRWQGPFLIHEVCSPVTMKLREVYVDKVLPGTYHVQELKPCIREADRSDVESDSEGSESVVETDEDNVNVSNSSERVLRPRGKTQKKLQDALLTLGGRKH